MYLSGSDPYLNVIALFLLSFEFFPSYVNVHYGPEISTYVLTFCLFPFL